MYPSTEWYKNLHSQCCKRRYFGQKKFIENYNETLKQVNERSEKNSKKHIIKESKGSKLKIQIADWILVRNKTNLKQEALLIGPYKITEVGEHHVEYQRGIVRIKVKKRNIQLW